MTKKKHPTPTKTNESPLKINGWKMYFLLKWFLFLGDEFVSFREGTLVNYCYYPPSTTFTEFQVVPFLGGIRSFSGGCFSCFNSSISPWGRCGFIPWNFHHEFVSPSSTVIFRILSKKYPQQNTWFTIQVHQV